MKTNAAPTTLNHFRVCLKRRYLALVLVAAAIGFGPSPVWAGGINTYDLVLTEISSNNLMLSYNGPAGPSGFTVVPFGTDFWQIQVTSLDISLSTFTGLWQEPEAANEVNLVYHDEPAQVDGPAFGRTINVFSDYVLTGTPIFPILGNNTASPFFIGFDSTQTGTGPGNIRLTFNDLAAQSETGNGVPDNGSSLSLLALSGIGLIVLSRRRQLA